MYAMCGKLIARAGKRDQFIDILKQASGIVGELSGCRLYLVNEDLSSENTIWVYEAWDDKESHDASLQDGRVRSLIALALPLMDGSPEGVELEVVGGYGLPV